MATIDAVNFLTSPTKSVEVKFTLAANETAYMLDLTDFSIGQSSGMNIDFVNNKATLDYDWQAGCNYRADLTVTADYRRMATGPAIAVPPVPPAAPAQPAAPATNATRMAKAAK